ncbi:MAG TPA: response regulator [Pyrinomonadaceae bacterium]|nr:response regulator [Pyrinomonadaceae bacterium]
MARPEGLCTLTTPNSNVARSRRALIVADDEATRDALAASLRAAVYETRAAMCDGARALVAEFAPDVLIAVAGEREGGASPCVALVRGLRSEAATYALPVVILFRADERALRSAAASVGADDYFALDSSAEHLRARLDALFWRTEAGRRASPSEQREEIDNFLLLLDAVRADAGAETPTRGSIALVAASARAAGDAEGLLREAHGFLKLNLRRLDAVAFYGPTLLFVYLPGRDATEARATLARIVEEFESTRARARLLTGLASFPVDERGVEQLIETAEQRLESAREADSKLSRVGGSDPRERAASFDERASAASVDVASESAERPHTMAATRESKMLDAIDASTRSLLGERRPAEAPRASMATVNKRDDGGALPRRLLLVVSDASLMARLNLLLRSTGAEVRAAFDARQALSLLRIERPGLVLVSESLADMEGVEMLRRLAARTGGRLASPAVLLVAGSGGSAAREAIKIGARVVACVPYNPEEILDSLVRAAVQSD